VIVLDTHVLVWADSDDRKLGRRARALIDQLWAVGNSGKWVSCSRAAA
jgi:PIN domain nuclease of toxin-antitoxin system